LAEPIFQSGQELEYYRIEKPIGKGGMSELFLARDELLNKRVVIKVLGHQYTGKEKFRKQFLREARIQANLENPYIVPIFRMLRYQEKYCLVMQYVKGTDLEKVIKKARSRRQKRNEKGALSTERAVHIFSQVLEGIAFAHRYRIIHGDIKPSNVLLDQQGRAKVADFGLSFLLPRGIREKQEMLQGGTPIFMSPEQILDEEVDFRSDVYSLGVTLFFMVTGRSPTGPGKKLTDILEFHVEGSLDGPREILAEFEEIPFRIREAILKALESDPDKRHQSCLEFSLAIKEDSPLEMYSELLRLSLLTKKDITRAERAYLDKIAWKRGLTTEEAMDLEVNIRKEMRLPPLDFSREYGRVSADLSARGEEGEDRCPEELIETYVTGDREETRITEVKGGKEVS
jgi:serine/threonine protein kinase